MRKRFAIGFNKGEIIIHDGPFVRSRYFYASFEIIRETFNWFLEKLIEQSFLAITSPRDYLDY